MKYEGRNSDQSKDMAKVKVFCRQIDEWTNRRTDKWTGQKLYAPLYVGRGGA